MRMLWFKLRDAGSRTWKVYLVEDVLDEDGTLRVPRLGITHYDRREIEVTIKQSWRELQSTVIHELMHAAAGCRRGKPGFCEFEEAFVSKAEKSLLRMAQQLGLTVPPLPVGVMLQPELMPKRKAVA